MKPLGAPAFTGEDRPSPTRRAPNATYTAKFGTTVIYGVTYTRDALARIQNKVETTSTGATSYTYGYDVRGRLTDVATQLGVGAPTTVHYNFDANGNRTSVESPIGTTTASATHDAQDRLLSYGAATYTYTPNGEVLSKTEGSALTGYVYDAMGNLRAVSLPDGRLIEYVVDGKGRRVGKKVNGALTRTWVYRGHLHAVAEIDATSGVVTRYVYGSNRNTPDYLLKSGGTYRIVADEMGRARLVVDVASGVVAQRLAYDEFGNVTLDSSPGFQSFTLAGGLYDPDTGLVRIGARDYDPSIGRWTLKDPSRFGTAGTNAYLYVHGDPVNLVDHSGKDVYICNSPTFGGAANHQWLWTTTGPGDASGQGPEAGMGNAFGHGNSSSTEYGAPVRMTDQNGDHNFADPNNPDAKPRWYCIPVHNVDEDCVKDSLAINPLKGENNLGNWSVSNTCQVTVDSIIAGCTLGGGDDWE